MRAMGREGGWGLGGGGQSPRPWKSTSERDPIGGGGGVCGVDYGRVHGFRVGGAIASTALSSSCGTFYQTGKCFAAAAADGVAGSY